MRYVTPVSLIWINRKNGSRTIANRKAKGAPLQFEAGEMRPRVLLFDGHELEASLTALEAFRSAISAFWKPSTRTLNIIGRMPDAQDFRPPWLRRWRVVP